MKGTILYCAAAAALAAGLGGCVHITNTYTGLPPASESQSATRAVADKGSGDCGCRGYAPAYYPQSYAPNPYQTNPYAGYYPPPGSTTQVYAEYPNYYPVPVYVPYGAPYYGAPSGGYYGERPTGGSGEEARGETPRGRESTPRGEEVSIGSRSPQGYESRDRRPADPEPQREQPVRADAPGPDRNASSGLGRGTPPIVPTQPRADAGRPTADATPVREERPATTGPRADAAQGGAAPVSHSSVPRVDRSPASRGNQEVTPSHERGGGERSGEGASANPRRDGASEVAHPSESLPPAGSGESRARREMPAAPVSAPVSHGNAEASKGSAPTPTTTASAPATEQQARRDAASTPAAGAPVTTPAASGSSSRVRRSEGESAVKEVKETASPAQSAPASGVIPAAGVTPATTSAPASSESAAGSSSSARP